MVATTLVAMFETAAELDDLQRLLDTSLARSTSHLRSIVQPNLTAAQLATVLSGMCVLSVATVTAGGEPRISALDGHFWHGTWIFGTERSAAKAKHLAVRPAVSVAHLRGEELGTFTHGRSELLNPAAGPAADEWPEILAHLTRHYGESPEGWGDVVYFRVHPHWMVAYAPDAPKLLAEAAQP